MREVDDNIRVLKNRYILRHDGWMVSIASVSNLDRLYCFDPQEPEMTRLTVSKNFKIFTALLFENNLMTHQQCITPTKESRNIDKELFIKLNSEELNVRLYLYILQSSIVDSFGREKRRSRDVSMIIDIEHKWQDFRELIDLTAHSIAVST